MSPRLYAPVRSANTIVCVWRDHLSKAADYFDLSLPESQRYELSVLSFDESCIRMIRNSEEFREFIKIVSCKW